MVWATAPAEHVSCEEINQRNTAEVQIFEIKARCAPAFWQYPGTFIFPQHSSEETRYHHNYHFVIVLAGIGNNVVLELSSHRDWQIRPFLKQ